MKSGKAKPKSRLLSVVIPTFNRDQPLRNTLQSLLVQDYPRFEIIVVDQSTKKFPPKEAFLKKKHFKVWHHSPPNAAAARNLGISQAKGAIILFLDDDVICQKNLLKNHVKNYRDARIGAVAGRVIDRSSKRFRDSHRVGQITWYGQFTDGFAGSQKQMVLTGMTCNASWRREVLKKLQGFDENFTGPIREDSDLCLRTINEGHQIIFEPQAVVVHQRAKTGGFRKTEGRLQWYRGFFKNETYFFLKHRPKILLPLVLLTRANLILRGMFGFGHEVSWRSLATPWQGIGEGIKAYGRWRNDHRG
ncbi:glycosyltransferase [Candidatus Shapirobacteria bacterium CG10_big_fil_rev_8_21_14_0_10_48_15]|uniref:Glycosyltransferase n=1 Tax=Candidatus Shapirobacteria bacterium CG10_big_fil_rev_8_21_14_0_10_48_15 TaxID=1974484 RepID=A0A2M8L6W8_9BACT|nr:MAG: glycosyltransferase [Candidatus Shapirobacteria bacterium CG10_big_fil_rev_8_21_14_0_10_48_15]